MNSAGRRVQVLVGWKDALDCIITIAFWAALSFEIS